MLEGRVVRVLSERELVINIGSNAGVQKGLKFSVLGEAPLELRDPETGESLGEIDREKVRIQAREIAEKFTICVTYRKKFVPASGFRLGGGFLEPYTPARREAETLRAEDAVLPPPIDPEDSYVKIGDRVKQIEDDD